MKTLMISLAACIVLFNPSPKEEGLTSGQSGTIVYEETEQISINLGDEASQFSHLLPKEKVTRKILYFSDKVSLYENESDQGQEGVQDTEMDGMKVQMRIIVPDNKTFTDLENNRQVEQREFMSRVFLIEKEYKLPNWKITENRKTVLDYPCVEAIYEKEDGSSLSVWFTPSIPVPAGPDTLGHLPGMILEADLNQGEKIIRAVSIDMAPVDMAKLTRPKNGKKVSEEQYQAIVNEKLKELGVENAEGGTHVKTAVVEISN